MRYVKSERGFNFIMHETHENEPEETRLVSESSAVNLDAHLAPGGDFLWIGEKHHLNHEEVREVRDALTHWLDTGNLPTGESDSNG